MLIGRRKSTIYRSNGWIQGWLGFHPPGRRGREEWKGHRYASTIDPPPPRGGGGGIYTIQPGGPVQQSTFVSSYYQMPEGEVVAYLQRKRLAYRQAGAEIALKECPACPPHRNKPDNLYKLYVSRSTGAHFCHRCGVQGSWFDLKTLLGDPSGPGALVPASTGLAPSAPKPGPSMATVHSACAALAQDSEMMAYLAGRALEPSVVAQYYVGKVHLDFVNEDNKWERQRCFSFPWIVRAPSGGAETAIRLKARGLRNKAQQRLDPSGGGWGLFGWHTVPDDADEVVLTEGEFDAMAVHQATGLPAVSLPNGARSLPLEVLPLLERFRRIYLWMDDDVAGQEGARKFAIKLGQARCCIVHSRQPGDSAGPKDANDALKAGLDLRAMIERAEPFPHKEIVRIDGLLPDVFRELQEADSLEGKVVSSLPTLNRILKGHRRGELTVLTGATGVGKTTFLGQLALDYCTGGGVATLWGSFEIKNARLGKKMMLQFAKCPRDKLLASWDSYAKDFGQLPMYFMLYFGSTTLEHVLDAMDYAVYAYDVEHVILDNLQFMTSGQSVGVGKFDLQDKAVEEFRRFATARDVHITLVIHPRKQDEGELLNTASVFGSAKATQEADNVLILQKAANGHKYLDVRKNRYDGELGRVPLKFDPASHRYTEMAVLDTSLDVNNDSSFAPLLNPFE